MHIAVFPTTSCIRSFLQVQPEAPMRQGCFPPIIPNCNSRFNPRLNRYYNAAAMRVILAVAVALLVLNFVDEHFNDGRYSGAVASMFLSIRQSFGA